MFSQEDWGFLPAGIARPISGAFHPDEPLAKRLFAMADNGGELRELSQLIRLKERLDLLLVVIRAFP